MRKPLQGIGNILRFNWPFYALAGGALRLLFIGSYWLPAGLQKCLGLTILLAILGIGISALVSWCAYDDMFISPDTYAIFPILESVILVLFIFIRGMHGSGISGKQALRLLANGKPPLS